MWSNQFKVGKLKASALLFKKEKSVDASVCKMERYGRERRDGEDRNTSIFAVTNNESDNVEEPPICLTAFHWSATGLFKTKSSAFLKGLLKRSDSLQRTNASSFSKSHCLKLQLNNCISTQK